MLNKCSLRIDKHPGEFRGSWGKFIDFFSHFCLFLAYFEGNIPSKSAGACLFKQVRLFSTIRYASLLSSILPHLKVANTQMASYFIQLSLMSVYNKPFFTNKNNKVPYRSPCPIRSTPFFPVEKSKMIYGTCSFDSYRHRFG